MAGALVTTNILQTLVAMGLDTLRERCVMPRIVNREYEQEIVGVKRGATVNVAVPATIATRSVTPDVVPPAVTAVTPTSIPVTVDQWNEAPFALDDKGIAQVLGGIVPMQAKEAIKALANTIDNYLWAFYKKFYGYAGVAATVPFATDLSEYLDADKLANDQLMDPDPRFMLINTAARANALGLRAIQDASYRGSTQGIVYGEIGEILGARWAMTQNVPTHTKGTEDGNYVINNGLIAIGTKTLTVDGGSGTILEGDVFTLPGDTQTYVVVSTVGGGTVTSIVIEPGLKVATVDGYALTFKAGGPQNLLIHRDAIAFAMAPLQDTAQTENRKANTAIAIDEESGLSLRLEVSDQYKQTQWAFDALYGAAVVRREFGVRVAG
jgi:hypothetical protein